MALHNKVALVTGGGQGIGQVVAEKLASMGAHAILADINIENAEKKVRLGAIKGKFEDLDISEVVNKVHQADIEIIAN